jgi:hypothetical protein
MVAFPSGRMGGGLPPSGGAFGPSAGKQSGVNWGSINQFLEGPFQDLTEGLASVITKDNAYRQYINEKRSARKRQRLQNVLEPMEMVAGMIAKEPRLAKMYAPGGAYDGFLQTQSALIEQEGISNGLDGKGMAERYMTLIAAMSQLPDDSRTPFEKDVDTLRSEGIEPTQEELKKGAGVYIEPQQADADQKLSDFKGADGRQKIMMQRPDNSTYVIDAGEYKPDRVAGDAEASVAKQKLDLAFAAAGVPVGTPIEQLTLEQAQAVQAKLGSTDFLTNLIGALGANNASGGGLGGVDLDAALGATPAAVPTGDGKPASDYKVGDKVAVDGVEATVTAVLPDGRLKIKAANGRTGTIVP